MKYYIFLVYLSLIACNSTESALSDMAEHLRQVGDIPFDKAKDNPDYQACDEASAGVHYNFDLHTLYRGEKPAMIKPFEKIKSEKVVGETGYITIRFMVNCKGKSGRFRLEQIDQDYKTREFNPGLVAELWAVTKSLDGWLPAVYEGEAYDYYKYLTFKIVDNQIVDILP